MKQLLIIIISFVSILGGTYVFVSALSDIREEYSNPHYSHTTAGGTYVPVDWDDARLEQSALSPYVSFERGADNDFLPDMQSDISKDASDYLFSSRSANAQTTGTAAAATGTTAYGMSYAYVYMPSKHASPPQAQNLPGSLSLLSYGGAANRASDGGGNLGGGGGVSSSFGQRSLSAIHNTGTGSEPLANDAGFVDPDNESKNDPPPQPLPVSDGMGVLIVLVLMYGLRKKRIASSLTI